MDSLFVISLPRSGSGRAYTLARYMLGLRAPAWTGDGEILNLDRFAGHPVPRGSFAAHFTTRERDPALFGRLTEFLDTVVRAEGFAYKDVVHPFVVSGWSGLRRLRVLHVRRDPAEVAYAMLRQRWYYPAAAVDPGGSSDRPRRWRRRERSGLTMSEAVLRGLLLAERALEQVPAVRLDFADLLPGRSGLAAALQQLYPDADLQRLPPDTEPEITISRVRRERIRGSAEYRALADLLARTRESLA